LIRHATSFRQVDDGLRRIAFGSVIPFALFSHGYCINQQIDMKILLTVKLMMMMVSLVFE
jgi:hypothetical protein